MDPTPLPVDIGRDNEFDSTLIKIIALVTNQTNSHSILLGQLTPCTCPARRDVGDLAKPPGKVGLALDDHVAALHDRDGLRDLLLAHDGGVFLIRDEPGDIPHYPGVGRRGPNGKYQ